MNQYYITDQDGKKLIIEKASGIRVEILVEPSQAFIDKLPPVTPLPEGRDYSAEIDQLKKDVKDIQGKLPKPVPPA